MKARARRCLALLLLIGSPAVSAQSGGDHPEIAAGVSAVLERISKTLSPQARVALTPDEVVALLTPEERSLFAAGFLRFRLDRPARLYVAYDSAAGETPFWLAGAGFVRAAELDFIVDEEDPYVVWTREVAAGAVGLGVPSFSGQMKPYVVLVAAQAGDGPVGISGLREDVDVISAAPGARPFLDDDDAFRTLPDRLAGLPVIRSYERWELVSRIVGYFRETPYPSGATPDHLQLTWQDDPATGVTVQWRSRAAQEEGLLWLAPKAAFFAQGDRVVQRHRAVSSLRQARPIVNDEATRLHRVRLRGLLPATEYLYAVSVDGGRHFTAPRRFRTAAPAGSEPYSFIYLGDPQNGLDQWGQLIRQANFRFPEARFYLIAGDLIDHGNAQDEWDTFFHESSPVFDGRAVLPAVGNHDSHGGHPTLYLQQFALPDNGSEELDPGRTYHLRYQDLLVVVMDSNYSLIPPATQTAWLDRVLGESDARWKVVVYHHPFYASHPVRDNAPLREAWGGIFDRHQVDIAFQGHDHAYMRTVPMRGHRPAAEGEHGTIYLVAVSGTKMYEQSLPAFAAFGITDTRSFQHIRVSPEGRLQYEAISAEGEVIDRFELYKNP